MQAGASPTPEKLLKWRLTLDRKCGHIRMTINFGRHAEDTEKDQSPGTEFPDAMKKAKRVWKFSASKLVSATTQRLVYEITPPSN